MTDHEFISEVSRRCFRLAESNQVDHRWAFNVYYASKLIETVLELCGVAFPEMFIYCEAVDLDIFREEARQKIQKRAAEIFHDAQAVFQGEWDFDVERFQAARIGTATYYLGSLDTCLN